MPSCPQYNVGVGGMMFHRFTNPPVSTDQDTGETMRAFSKGSVEMLTDAQANSLKSQLLGKVVKRYGNGRGNIFNTTSKGYERHASDEPLAMHVYILPMSMDSVAIRERKDGWPPTVYEMAGGQMKAQTRPSRKTPDIAPEIEDLDKPAHLRHSPPQLQGRGK
jgi:hypothetical protein